jgi:P pilus assembly chaperone PapD
MEIKITDYLQHPKDADTIPTVTLYDPLRNVIVQDVKLDKKVTGIYSYKYTLSSSQPSGIWEAEVVVTVNGITNRYSEYWELKTSPAEVRINSITNNTAPTIAANVTVINEGFDGYEYGYEYCIVKNQTISCNQPNVECYGSGSKWLQPGQVWNTQLGCDVTTPGNYWFKVIVHYGTQLSGASKMFTAVWPTKIGFEITKLEKEILVNKGVSKQVELRVNNTGDASINLNLSIESLPSAWFTITPTSITLEKGKEGVFNIVFTIPQTVSIGNYSFQYVVKGKGIEKTEWAVLRVLQSEKNVFAEVEKLEEVNKIISVIGVAILILIIFVLYRKREHFEITKFEKEILVNKRVAKQVELKVKNIGNHSINLNLRLEGVSPTWFMITPTSITLEKGEEGAFDIVFYIPQAVRIGDYTFYYVVEEDGVKKKEAAILRVLKREGHRLEIKRSKGKRKRRRKKK